MLYTPPVLNAVNFELTSYTKPDLSPYISVLALYTPPALNAVGFTLQAYMPPVMNTVNFEFAAGPEVIVKFANELIQISEGIIRRSRGVRIIGEAINLSEGIMRRLRAIRIIGETINLIEDRIQKISTFVNFMISHKWIHGVE